MPTRDPGPRSTLRSLAQAISSAGDPALAAWQEDGLTAPDRGGSAAVWGILVVSCAAGTVAAVVSWLAVWHALSGMTRPPSIGGSRMSDPALLLVLVGAVCVVLAAALSFALYQGLCALAYRGTTSRQPRS